MKCFIRGLQLDQRWYQIVFTNQAKFCLEVVAEAEGEALEDEVVVLGAGGVGEDLELVEPVFDLVAEFEGEVGSVVVDVPVPAEAEEGVEDEGAEVAVGGVDANAG